MDTFIDQTLTTYPGLSILDAKEKQASSLIKAEKGKYYPEGLPIRLTTACMKMTHLRVK